MDSEILTDQLVDILEGLREMGGVDCSGNCRIRLPGEVHCSSISADLGISPTSVKNKIQDLFHMGLVLRNKKEVTGGSRTVFRFVISPLGEKTLETHHKRLQEEGIG